MVVLKIIKRSYVDINGFHIKKKYLTKEQIKKIEKELIVSPRSMDYNEIEYEMFTQTSKSFTLPVYWGKQFIGLPAKEKYTHEKSNMKFKGCLRKIQQPIVDKSLGHINSTGGGLITVRCGGGKTVMSLYLACMLGLKTLVIVNTKELQAQWILRIKEFTTANVGIIRGKIIDIEDKDIVIGSIQSISQKDYEKGIFDRFGFVIYDEAHHVASRYFSRTLLKTCTKYTLALTATPERPDGLIKVMYWFLGECMYRQSMVKNRKVMVKRIIYNTDDPEKFKELTRGARTKTGWKKVPDPNGTTIKLCKIKNRTKLQIKIIVAMIKANKKRKILILSRFKDHLTQLKTGVDKKLDKLLKEGFLKYNEITSCYFHGDLKDKERAFARENGDIFFGTFSIAQEGLDIPKLNTLMMCTSQKKVKQAAGRIMRKILDKGDVRPLIVDFTDDLPILKSHSDKRDRYFSRAEYQREDTYAFKDRLVSYKTYMKKKELDMDNDQKTQKKLDNVFKITPIGEHELQEQLEESDGEMKYESDSGQEYEKAVKERYVKYRKNVFKR